MSSPSEVRITINENVVESIIQGLSAENPGALPDSAYIFDKLREKKVPIGHHKWYIENVFRPYYDLQRIVGEYSHRVHASVKLDEETKKIKKEATKIAAEEETLKAQGERHKLETRWGASWAIVLSSMITASVVLADLILRNATSH